MIEANYIALSILNESFKDSMQKITKGLEQCGGLDHKDTKLNDSAKEYFKAQTEEHKKSLEIVRDIHKEITARLWAK